jgi:UDP-N-acetylmuramyl pentapeptide synthase
LKKILIVDLTHGGIILATEFSKNPDHNVFGWDIYHTLKEAQRKELEKNRVHLVDDNFIDSIKDSDQIQVIAPVHCPLPFKPDMTHHQAVKFLLEKEINIPVIEVTGVKGKTSTVHMLKEIFRDDNPILLSSNGVEVIQDNKEIKIVDNISITPSSIITAWRRGTQYFSPGICVFETSLGGTGLADVGVITNLAENYSIAGGNNSAAQAKEQIFSSKMVIVQEKSLNSYYSHMKNRFNVKSFSINQSSNITVSNVQYGLKKTVFTLNFSDFRSITGETINKTASFETFAPSPYHLENILSAIGAALAVGKPLKSVIKGVGIFKGIKGRTSILEMGDCRVIEEINPGINITAIKKSVKMMDNLDNPSLIIGGQYGITCEEINEDQLIEFLDHTNSNIDLVLVDELGKSVYSEINRPRHYKSNIDDAISLLADLGSKNILLIYRSNYANFQKR